MKMLLFLSEPLCFLDPPFPDERPQGGEVVEGDADAAALGHAVRVHDLGWAEEKKVFV